MTSGGGGERSAYFCSQKRLTICVRGLLCAVPTEPLERKLGEKFT